MNKQELDLAIAVEIKRFEFELEGAKQVKSRAAYDYKRGTKSPAMLEYIVRRACQLHAEQVPIPDTVGFFRNKYQSWNEILAAIKNELE